MEKFIMAGDCALRVYDSGNRVCGESAEVLVLLHGYLESLEIWDDMMTFLVPNFRVIALDLPGHGISEVKGEIHTMEFLADTVAAALKSLGVETCVLVGHSMGGYVALEFLRRHEAMLRGFVLLHSTPNPDTDAKLEQREREIGIVLSGKKDMLAQIAPSGAFAVANRKRLRNRIEELADQILLTEDEGMVALLRGMAARVDTNDVLASSKVPQLFIFGRGDEFIVEEVAQKIIDQHSQAQFVWLEESGHMSLVEQPREASEAIIEFAKGV